MNGILGIDLGTSSVKMIYTANGKTEKRKVSYETADPKGWWQALCEGTKSLDLKGLRAIGLSSQVGTYIIDDRDVITWSDPAAAKELDALLAENAPKLWLDELDMLYPKLTSYPLPRLLYIKKHYPNAKKVYQPKDMLCQRLTGRYVSDRFSWRGLAYRQECHYSQRLLSLFDLAQFDLPALFEPTDILGHVTAEAAKETGIPMGTPIVAGCNDFHAGLVGMGIGEPGEAFDVTGTSEHFGLLFAENPIDMGNIATGGYFGGYVGYGVTASSGSSLDFGLRLNDLSAIDPAKALERQPPVFLPYVNGERAPIFDPHARGVFFGIDKDTTEADLAYAVAEGVCFSIYHIYEALQKPTLKGITASGSAGESRLLNQIKATLLGCPVSVTEEKDASAFGACLLAAVTVGDYPSLQNAMQKTKRIKETVLPCPDLQEALMRRFELYRSLYPSLKDHFINLKL